jgi:hypothetical protein
MAVFQISRIQIRRGKATSGTGIPQLASGEMAWAVDTQELYIGSGSVSEGAPGVGNCRVLTLNDITLTGNILSIGTYGWHYTDPSISTGISAGLPTVRTIQQKLDDFVTSADFGMVGDDVTIDNTVAFQNAINQLFLNSSHPANAQTITGTASRYTLVVLPGVYKITGTIYIPPYAKIQGAGLDKTVFNYAPALGNTTPAFKFVNDTWPFSSPNEKTGVLYSNQPRHIQLSDFTIQTYLGTNTGLELYSVRNSIFRNITIKGGDQTGRQDVLPTNNPTNLGIVLTGFSKDVTCENNQFENINVYHTTVAVFSKQDILNNTFDNCFIWDAQQGFSFGFESLGGNNIGQQYGPRQNSISNSKFYQIKRHAVYIERGEFNTVTDCKMENVGNNNAGPLSPIYPQVFFKSLGNIATNIHSDRADFLANPSNSVQAYIPEVTGNVSFRSPVSYQAVVGQTTSGNILFRLPASTDHLGVPAGAISYNIEYVYRDIANTVGVGNATLPFTRSGNFYITADVYRAKIHYADDYTFAGTDADNSIAQVLTFSAIFLDEQGNLYTGALGQKALTLAVFYVNTLANDSGVLNYSYTFNSYYPT